MGPRLYAYASRQVGKSRADDLVADTLVIALRRMSSVPASEAEAFVWLVATARRVAANQRRRRMTEQRHWQQAVRDFWQSDTSQSVEAAVTEREQSLAALAALSETDRELLLLVAWEGLTPQDAAGVLGISGNAFAVRLHRSRQRLMKALDAGWTDRTTTTEATP